MKKKATITVETERLLVISRARGHAERWCEQCAAQVDMIAAREAAALAGLSERQIFQMVESGAIHVTETAEGKALFCVASILRESEGARQLTRPSSKQKG